MVPSNSECTSAAGLVRAADRPRRLQRLFNPPSNWAAGQMELVAVASGANSISVAGMAPSIAVARCAIEVQPPPFRQLHVVDELTPVPEAEVGQVQPLGGGPTPTGCSVAKHNGGIIARRSITTTFTGRLIWPRKGHWQPLRAIMTRKRGEGWGPPRPIAAPIGATSTATSQASNMIARRATDRNKT